MDIIKFFELLDITVGEFSIGVVVVLTLVQIAPIKINPWSWIAKKIGHAINGEVLEKVADLDKRVKDLDTKMNLIDAKDDERAAVNWRVRILRFDDELYSDKRHSRESFEQALDDITEYERYTKRHPDFRNNKTMLTVEHIKKVYADRLEKHDFL